MRATKSEGKEAYDLIIIGGGPAGLSAGVYAKRAGLKAVLLEKGVTGGQLVFTDIVENYPGFARISGPVLGRKLEAQTRKSGLEIKNLEAIKLERGRSEIKRVSTFKGDYEAKAVLIATGSSPEMLGVKGEMEFIGRGVSYCATCDGFFCQSKEVAVIGGCSRALSEALFLSKLASRVYILHRRNTLSAEKILQEYAKANRKIEFLYNTTIEEVTGKSKVEKIRVKNLKTGEQKEIQVEGVFIYAGLRPNTDLVDVRKDSKGFIITDENMETSIKGVYAAGDCRAKKLKNILSAVSEGATAAMSAGRYILERENDKVQNSS